MIEAKTKLNPRQYALRRLLERHSGEWLNASEIYELMEKAKNPATRYRWDGKTDFFGRVGRRIFADVRRINASGAFDKIIVSDKADGYKLATKKEYERYAKSRWGTIARSIRYQTGLDKQAGLDGQAIIRFPSVPYGEAVHEVFVKEAKR